MARFWRSARFLPAVFTIFAAISCARDTAAPSPAASGPVRGGSLTVSIRAEPGTFNRLSPRGGNQGAVDAITRVMHATLVRVNRVTGDVEPWLVEKWTAAADGRSYTLTLRDGITFSDGQPFTSADVAFTFQALYDPKVDSPVASALKVAGKPLQIATPNPRTVVITLPAPFAPGIALLDNVPILPKHQLQAALDAGTFAEAWGTSTPPAGMAGLGPFTMGEYVRGQRITFLRNPRYFRKDASGGALPYLDRLVMEYVAGGQDPEILRLESGAVDFLSQADVRPEDMAALRRLRDQGSLQLVEVGISVDPNCLWFNLTPGAAAGKAKPYLLRPEFRRAISLAVDRAAIANTVYLGAAAPVYGPITPGNKTWYAPSPRTEVHDPAQAKALLAGLGLTDRNGDGMLDDWNGQPVKFSVLVQRGTIRERTVTMVQEQVRQVGIAMDVVGLDVPSMFGRFGAGDYESIYHGFQASAFDPGLNLDFWLSGGSAHVWNTGAAAPWEQAMDVVMKKQAAAATLAERQQLLREAERIFAENLPQIYFVAPKVTVAMTRKVGGAVPVLLDPKILWNADSLFVKSQ